MNDFDLFSTTTIDNLLPKRDKTIVLRLIEDYLIRDNILNEEDLKRFRKETLKDVSRLLTYFYWGSSFKDPFALHGEYMKSIIKKR